MFSVINLKQKTIHHITTSFYHIMITMPMPPHAADRTAFDYYQCFIRHMNDTPFPDDSDKVADAIDRTAKDTDSSPAYVARLLVSQGLRAPRSSFPDDFIDYVTAHINRHNSPVAPMNKDIEGLAMDWGLITEKGKESSPSTTSDSVKSASQIASVGAIG